nr:hypothetical protein [Pedobacter panaciterrae]
MTFKLENAISIIKSTFLLLCMSVAYSSSSAFAIENARGLKYPVKHSVNDTIVILWNAEKGRMVLNEDFLKNVTDFQRAAIGYIATQAGNDCHWDGPRKEDESNLKCKLLTALNLGYMCSSQHLSFLKKWFRQDEKSMEELQRCSKRAVDDPISDKFNYILLISKGETLTITYEAKGRNLDDLRGWRWIKETVFQPIGNNGIKVAKWQNLDFQRYKF